MMTVSQQYLLFLCAVMGFAGVAVGAFGAHALKQRLQPDMLAIFEVGVRYQMYHVLAMGLALGVAILTGNSWGLWAGWLFFAGMLIFSGSLYILALSGVKAWGMVTPIGGLLFLLGWLCLAVTAFKGTG